MIKPDEILQYCLNNLAKENCNFKYVKKYSKKRLSH